MALFDYVKSRGTADKLIAKFGMKAKLRRNGVDRDCVVAIPEYMSREKPTDMANPTDRQVFIAAGLGDVPTTPPNNELDRLVTFVQPLGTVVDEVLEFTGGPVKPLRPAGITVVYQTTVRR
jgi:hypothetical protein